MRLKKQGLTKLKAIGTMATIFAIKANMCFATDSGGGIGTAEVTAATENIKRVITSIAMPLRWSFNICKYCYSCNKDDSERKQSTKKSRKHWLTRLDLWWRNYTWTFTYNCWNYYQHCNK